MLIAEAKLVFLNARSGSQKHGKWHFREIAFILAYLSISKFVGQIVHTETTEGF